MNLLNQSVGWLARNIPGSTEIFRQYQLDFCCGGNQILRDVLEQKQLDADPIIARLESLQSQGTDERDWSLAPRTALITYINPAVAVILGIVILGEPLTLGLAIGFPLVLLGSWLATRRGPVMESEPHA